MKNQIEIAKVNSFLSLVSPVVVEVVRASLQLAGCEINQEGKGLDLAFSIKSGEKEIKFFLHNLLLEIATIDRDEKPLRFDENLNDLDYRHAKITGLIESKLRILFQLLAENDMDAAIDNISKNTKGYEHIRILKLDPKNSSQATRE
jgi:hypothetical protein